ncbi:MAG: sigma-70 family RNA polymerase sigma factor [Clostridiales bacterium]|nr:sigma-70 family RNA polymerase sigma factor [Clostridiales bacterium]
MDQERKWVRAIQKKGDRQAADQLIRAYYDEIYRFVFRQTGQKEDAMDLTQEIFLAVLGALPAFDPRRASFRTWLYRIAANKVIDARRRVRWDLQTLAEEEPAAPEDFAGQIQDRLLLEQIEAYVSGLDPQVQGVFRLRVYGQRTFPEIAEALGQPEAAVKARYYRLMGRLRKEFSRDG